jgi:hypothetical protein
MTPVSKLHSHTEGLPLRNAVDAGFGQRPFCGAELFKWGLDWMVVSIDLDLDERLARVQQAERLT